LQAENDQGIIKMEFKGEIILEFEKRFNDDRSCLAYLSDLKMHTVIHQLKSWLRSTYSRVHQYHTEKYPDKFSFRINRLVFKQNIFQALFDRMLMAKPFTYQMIKIVTQLNTSIYFLQV